jgi:hypothetical protein
MHPLLAEDFAKVLIDERIESARTSARRPRRHHMRVAVGRFLVALGSRLAA